MASASPQAKPQNRRRARARGAETFDLQELGKRSFVIIGEEPNRVRSGVTMPFMSSKPPALGADPQQKIDWLESEYGERFRALLDEATDLVDAPQALDSRGLRLVEIAREMAARIAPLTPCRSGCSHCCRQPVFISSWEAARIVKFSGRKAVDPVATVAGPDRNNELLRRFSGVPCPFLRNGRCTVYAVRPLVCIGHHSLASDSTPCDLVADPESTVLGVGDQEFISIKAALFLAEGHTSADIREFFPMQGSHTGHHLV